MHSSGSKRYAIWVLLAFSWNGRDIFESDQNQILKKAKEWAFWIFCTRMIFIIVACKWERLRGKKVGAVFGENNVV